MVYIFYSPLFYAVKDYFTEGNKNLRLRVFLITFLVLVIAGLIINYSRPAIYLSKASLLTSTAIDVDKGSSEIDFQHVQTQKKKLLEEGLLKATLARLKSLRNGKDLSGFTLLDVRNMLDVKVIKKTNLLTMRAEGKDPEVLPIAIGAWIDVYFKANVLSAKNMSNNEIKRIKSEINNLDIKINQSQQGIELFRKKHNITSTTKKENKLPARHNILTKSLGNANQKLIKSKLKLSVINEAIAAGQTIVPKLARKSLIELENEHRKLSKELAKFDSQFTRDYLPYKSSAKDLPERIKELEQLIKQKKKTGKGIVWKEAKEDYYNAEQFVLKIRRKLSENKARAVNFNIIFSKYKKLEADLIALKQLAKGVLERLVKVEARQLEEYSQIYVVEKPYINRQPIRPNYSIGSLVVFVVSLLLAFFVVWLRDYLMPIQFLDQGGRRDIQRVNPSDGVVNDRRLDWVARMLYETEEKVVIPEKNIEQEDREKLGFLPRYQKITDEKIQILLDKADKNTQQLILLLLSGLRLEEIANLSLEQIKNDFAVIKLSGEFSRDIPIGKALQEKLNESLHYGELWEQENNFSINEINTMLYDLDNENDSLNGVLAERLRQNYLFYLVEQGLDLSLLTKVVGYLPSEDLATYRACSFMGENYGIDEIQLIHPLCQLDEKTGVSMDVHSSL